MYSELAKGEIAGFEAGLLSDKSLWDYALSFQESDRANEYFMGLGAGFTEGQNLRKRLRDTETPMPFEDKVSHYLYFTKQRRYQRAFHNPSFEQVLNHQQLWHYHHIPSKIGAQSLLLLEEGKLQRALHFIHTYYLSHFCLAAWRSFEQIVQLLVQIRTDQKKGIQALETPAQQRTNVEQRLRAWIAKYSVGLIIK